MNTQVVPPSAVDGSLGAEMHRPASVPTTQSTTQVSTSPAAALSASNETQVLTPISQEYSALKFLASDLALARKAEKEMAFVGVTLSLAVLGFSVAMTLGGIHLLTGDYFFRGSGFPTGYFLTGFGTIGAVIAGLVSGVSTLTHGAELLTDTSSEARAKSSHEFESAKELYFGVGRARDPARAGELYQLALKGSEHYGLDLKCSHALLALASDPIPRGNKCSLLGSIVSKENSALDETWVVRQAAERLLADASPWLESDDSLSVIEKATILIRASRRLGGSHPSSAHMPEYLYQLAKGLASTHYEARQTLLHECRRCAPSTSVLKMDAEQLMLGNAAEVEGSPRFKLLLQILQEKHLLQESKVGIAHLLEETLPGLTPDEQLEANGLIMDLLPDSYESDGRAQRRERSSSTN